MFYRSSQEQFAAIIGSPNDDNILIFTSLSSYIFQILIRLSLINAKKEKTFGHYMATAVKNNL